MPPVIPDTPVVERTIVKMTNDFRAKNGKSPVRVNAQLTKAARAYANYLASTDQFSHTADGRDVGDRITAANYDWCTVGENLALHVDSRGFAANRLARKAIEGWINSPSHKKNMLTPHVTETGVGVVQAPDADPKFISVQLFARPRSLEYEFQISNTTKSTVHYALEEKPRKIQPNYAVTHRLCVPSKIKFSSLSSWTRSAPIFDARDGVVFQLEADQKNKSVINVTVAPRVKVD